MDTDKIAQAYARKISWDGVIRCGERNGYIYYSLYADRFTGKKSGQPAIIKIAPTTGAIINIDRINEIMWAISQINQRLPI